MRHFIRAAGIVCLAGCALAAQSGPHDARARDIFKELIEIPNDMRLFGQRFPEPFSIAVVP